MLKDSCAIVLAAGQGTRMKSKVPKVLNAAAGRSLIEHVLDGLKSSGISEIRIVVGHGGAEVRGALNADKDLKFFDQVEQRGTADAVKSAEVGSLKGPVIICNGDHPLIAAGDFKRIFRDFEEKACDLLVVSCEVKNPTGFGRVIRSQKGRILRIREERDATPDEKQIREVNSGIYVTHAKKLQELLSLVKNNNAKKEFYLTDIVEIALSKNLNVEVSRQAPRVARGVNTQAELAMAGKALFRRKALELMDAGIQIIDPDKTYIDGDVEVGSGTVIHPGVVLGKGTVIGQDCILEAYCGIFDSKISDGVQVRWGTIVEKSSVDHHSILGPYARLRPESVLESEVHVGNFVEIKKSRLGKKVKANHLTYLGDSEIGDETNIGCGTITCNYATDKKKYKTVIGKRVFVGSDTQFVAPVTVGDNAVIGSGSTITKDVPDGALAVARGRQFIKADYNKG